MGRKNKILTLPEEIITQINEMIGSERFTLDEIMDHLRELGVDDVSRSGLHRHTASIKQIAATMRRSRTVAESLTKHLGPSVKDGDLARTVIEMVHGLLMNNVTSALTGEAEDPSAMELMRISAALQKLASAQKLDVERVDKIREQATAEAVGRVEKEGKKLGMTKATIAKINHAVLGIEV